jgi:hypothetical protein
LLPYGGMSEDDLRKKARRRALRAAQVVTLGLAMATPGCGDSHTVDDVSETDAGPMVDAAMSLDQGLADLGRDLGPEEADMGMCPEDPFVTPPETEECCDEIGGWWDEASESCSVAVPGPFVPPSMSA